MRYWVKLLGAGLVVMTAGQVMTVGQVSAQVGYDRRGNDYTTFTIRNGDPAVCAARCEHDARCRAWSFSFPRTTDVAAACRLKNRVPERLADNCCVSGVRGAGVIEPRRGGAEFSIDRYGGDYRFFDTAADASGAACKAACEADKACRAWTYARPGYISTAPRCYLKSKLTRPRAKPCCISGVVR
jgi:hypothetical protein